MTNTILEIVNLPFMQRAILGGLMVAVVCSLVGTFMVLRRLSFFGDAIAHASLAGVAVGLLMGINPLITAFLVAIFLATLLYRFSQVADLSTDAVVGFFFSVMMAAGILIINTLPGYQPELLSFLFGNILSISFEGLLIILFLGIVIILGVFHFYPQLLSTTFDEEGAIVSGVNVGRINLIYHLMLATAVIISLKLVGVILVNALLIIPVSTAKLVSSSLRQMFLLSPVFGTAAVLIGLFSSYLLNLAPGPSIVVTAAAQFLVVLGIKRLF